VEIGKTLEKYTVKRSPAIKGAVSKSKGVVDDAAKEVGKVTANWKSVKEFGHTFNTHGAGTKNTKSLTDRALGTGTNQGQWLDNQKSAEYLKSLGDIKEPTTVSIPEGMGQVITPTGEILPATQATVVPSATGIKTAYPTL